MPITGSVCFYPYLYTFLSIPESPVEPNLMNINQSEPEALHSSHLETIKKTDAIFNFTISDDAFHSLSRYIEREIKTDSLIEFKIDDLCSLLEEIEREIPSESLPNAKLIQDISGTSTYWETMLNTQTESSSFPAFIESSLFHTIGKQECHSHEKAQQCGDIACQNKKTMIAIVEERLRQKWSPIQICKWLKQATGETLHRQWIYRHVEKDKANGGSLYKMLRYQEKIPVSMIAIIEEKLRQKWSPSRISSWFKRTASKTVSRQWIYQHIKKDKDRGGSLYRALFYYQGR